MNGSPVSAVLCLPELLEHILFLSLEDLNQQQDPRWLFQLQRINKTFQATIAGSVRLQRLMFLAPAEQPDYGSLLPHHKPTLWFFRDFLGLKVMSGRYTKRPGINLQDMRLDTSEVRSISSIGFPVDLIRRRGDSCASWRQMKVGGVEKPLPLYVHFAVFFKPKMVDHYAHPFYAINWHFRAETELGELFDRYLKILNSSDEEHLDAAARYWSRALEQ